MNRGPIADRGANLRGLTRLSLAGTIGIGTLVLALTTGVSSAGATTDSLFNSSTPGFTAGAAIVPANVCAVTVTTTGGSGGAGDNGGVGGDGASVTATVSVTPGEVLDVQVGGGGADYTTSTGGIGGGGGGNNGGGGGGASAIERVRRRSCCRRRRRRWW